MLSKEEAQYCYFGITFNKNTQGLIKWPNGKNSPNLVALMQSLYLLITSKTLL
jgi:hypothetical protein